MTLKEIFMQTTFDKVSPEARKVFHLFQHSYQKETDTLQHRVFDMLKDIEPNPIQSGWANNPFPKGSKMILSVIHGDVRGYIDEASLEKMTKEGREEWNFFYGLGMLPLNQWLGAEVESDLSPEAIVANFLYEVWRRLSDDEDILKVLTQGYQTEDDGKKQFKFENGVVTFYEGTTYISEYDLGYDQCVKEVKIVILPDSIIYIDYKAFVKCNNLTDVIVNGNVTCVGGTLDETPWYKNQPDGLVYVGNVLYGYKGEMPMGANIVLKEGTSGIANDAFRDCRGLTSIVIPNSVTKVGEFAFAGCSQLKSITLPSSLNVMEKGLFFGCSKLVSIVFPKTDFVIENGVFEACENLTHIEIPRNVKEIVPEQFYDCSTITVDKRNPIYDSREDCNAIIETATNILVAGCKTTIIPKTVKEIGDKAFSGCSELRSVNIPRSVSHIGLLAFSSCSGLSSIEIPNTVKKIENGAFDFCSNLKTVVIEGADTKIMPGAFDCDALPSIFVPAGSEERYKSMLPEELHGKIKTSIFSN